MNESTFYYLFYFYFLLLYFFPHSFRCLWILHSQKLVVNFKSYLTMNGGIERIQQCLLFLFKVNLFSHCSPVTGVVNIIVATIFSSYPHALFFRLWFKGHNFFTLFTVKRSKTENFSGIQDNVWKGKTIIITLRLLTRVPWFYMLLSRTGTNVNCISVWLIISCAMLGCYNMCSAF